MGKRLITASDVLEAAKTGQQTLFIPSDACIVTPMAKDEAARLGIVLNCHDPGCAPASACATESPESSSTKLSGEVYTLLKARLPAGTSAERLEAVIREVVSSKLGPGAAPKATAVTTPAGAAQGVHFIDHQRLLESGSGPIPVEETMIVAQAIGGQAEEKLAGGFMVWEKASFTRQVEQPEIAVVVEGELHLDVDGNTLVGKPGDMVYFPKGAVVAYSAPKRVKLACVNCI